jgi:hypothetical protein
MSFLRTAAWTPKKILFQVFLQKTFFKKTQTLFSFIFFTQTPCFPLSPAHRASTMYGRVIEPKFENNQPAKTWDVIWGKDYEWKPFIIQGTKRRTEQQEYAIYKLLHAFFGITLETA